uniref:Uncharacterized protein n=1 Tax=Brassica oleracea TaxID=3712 RepID=A0A3P6F7A7_BRAOL|nr:unnamed protein product [Brassica oleracea]
MPSSTRSNKETQLLFSSDPASLERSIRKGKLFSSIDNNTSSSIDYFQPPSTPTPISSTDTRFPPSTEDTLPSTDTFHLISIDTSVRTSIDTEPRDMVATLILGAVIHEPDTDATYTVQPVDEAVQISSTPTDQPFTHEEFVARYPHPPSPVYVKIDRHSDTPVDRQKETTIDRQHPAPIDQRAPLTYRVRMPKIDVARLNALRPQPKPSDNPPEAIRTPSYVAADPMEIDSVPMGRTLRKRKEKMVKHLKRGANEKERERVQKRTSRKRASTAIAYYPSIDTEVDSVRKGDYSIGRWEDDHHHESYAVETEIHEPGVDEPHEVFTYEELLNMERRDEADQQRAEATGERTRFSHSIDRANRQSIDVKSPSSIDIRPKPSSTYLTQNEFSIFRDPYGYARAIDGHALQVSIEDIADILQMANGADNLFMQQYTVLAHQQRVTKEFYDTAGGIDNHFKQKYRHPTRSSIDVDVPPSIDRHPEFGRRAFDLFGTRKLYWEEKDEYVVYRDDKGCARDVDGHIINVSKDDIRKLMESASRDEHIYICLPEHASSFTQTKLMKFDGVYYQLNDSISLLTTCMEEMRQDIAKIHLTNIDQHRSTDTTQHRSTTTQNTHTG